MKKRMSKIMNLFLVVVFVGLFIFSSFQIICWFLNNRENKKINETTHKYIIKGGKEKYSIDFKKLKDLNEDTVAYIKVNNTNIDYVVVQGKDNEYYLSHNFNKEYNKSGWIFADSSNKFDGTDRNIVIYGHNTVDKSMFGSLKFILEENWYKNENNRTVILVTENGLEKYEIFSIYKIDNEEYYIQTNLQDDSKFEKFLKTIKLRSIYNYGTEVSIDDHILTLSTCSNSGKKRVVLHAKKIIDNVETTN